jgi:hypothetical protein
MRELADMPEANNRKLLSRRSGRNLRRLTFERLIYIGRTLRLLYGQERLLCIEFNAAPETVPDAAVRIPLMCQLVKTLDVIHDRRRILCGDPLPRGGGSKPATRTLDLEPQSVPEPPMPEPGSGVD